MARPYMEPKMRKRMEAESNPMSEDGGNAPGSGAPPMEGEVMDPKTGETTIVKKAMLGGKQWKPGDEIVFVIKSIDPETGDAEIYYAPPKGGEGEEEPADSMEAMDKTFPAEEASTPSY